MKNVIWTETKDSVLKEMHGKGISLRDQATKMSHIFNEPYTRSTIAGRRSRTGLTSISKPASVPPQRKKAPTSTKPPEPKEGAIRGIPESFQCKYPVSGTGVETIYCEHRRTDKSYCEPHQEICYTASRY